MGFVHNQVIKGVVPELIQMPRHALHTAADYMGVRLLHVFHIPPHCDTGPQFTESFRSLVHQFLRMS